MFSVFSIPLLFNVIDACIGKHSSLYNHASVRYRPRFCIGCKNTAESFPHSFMQHTYGYVTCSKVNAKNSQTSSDVTI
jgi:hypothetical protein